MREILWIVYFIVILLLFLWRITTTHHIVIIEDARNLKKGDKIKVGDEGSFKIKKIKLDEFNTLSNVHIRKKTPMKERLKTLCELLHKPPAR